MNEKEEEIEILIYNLDQVTEVVSENHQSIKKILKRIDKLERLQQQQSRAFILICGFIVIGSMIYLYKDIVINENFFYPDQPRVTLRGLKIEQTNKSYSVVRLGGD